MEWKISKNVSEQVDDLSGNFEYQLGIDFSAYDPSNYFKSLRIFPCQDGEIRALDELGTGQEQILAISFA
jgi:putative ATP-dependent endonuclease of OLD family